MSKHDPVKYKAFYEQNRERLLRELREKRRGPEGDSIRAAERARRTPARPERFCLTCGARIDPERNMKARYCDAKCRAKRPVKLGPQPDPICAVSSCTNRWVANTLCVRHNHRARRYGLTPEQMADLDAGVPCHICGESAAVVDHSHVTNATRGYLCRGCNLGLGGFRDRPDLLFAAVAYLEFA